MNIEEKKVEKSCSLMYYLIRINFGAKIAKLNPRQINTHNTTAYWTLHIIG